MHRINAHQAQQGFMTIAQNNNDMDYLNLAYIQAISIKLTMPDSLYAVAVDKSTESCLTDKHRKVFDYIIPIEQDMAEHRDWKLNNEWQVFYLTPFKETIKLESDLVFTRDISHWWHTFRLRDLVLSHGCRDYLQNISDSRKYRKLFDDNKLPDVYNGLMYFRYSQDSAEFFWYAEQIFTHWDYVKDNLLVNCRDDHPTTDVVYALTAKIIGQEKCTLPSCDFVNFVHMKPDINRLSHYNPWYDLVVHETDLPMVRVNNINQYHPFHYYEKSWIGAEIIREYENELERRIS